jgi:hypothetical protein
MQCVMGGMYRIYKNSGDNESNVNGLGVDYGICVCLLSLVAKGGKSVLDG